LPYILGAKEYDENRNSSTPDKKKFKEELWDFYK
jgi:hypothetical protein